MVGFLFIGSHLTRALRVLWGTTLNCQRACPGEIGPATTSRPFTIASHIDRCSCAGLAGMIPHISQTWKKRLFSSLRYYALAAPHLFPGSFRYP